MDELLAELRQLCLRFPIPEPGPHPHPYTDQIVACRDDFERALELAAAHPAALEYAAEHLDDDGGAPFDADASPELTAAWRRLEALPLPNAEHPLLDAILPALDAQRTLLVALSRTVSH